LADTFNLLPLAECDVLINNAAIASDGLLATQSEQSIREVIDVNLIGTLLLTKRWVRARLTKQKSGCIVNISSIIGMRGYAGLAAYSATKAGLDGITRALARELGPKQFRVNSVLPGYVETDMSRLLTAPQRDQIIRRTPLGRLATATDISSVVAFLVSPAAGFVTGQCITVDGGICV
jgi:3-oxoacyl-[acyl-carrier protein] reductase